MPTSNMQISTSKAHLVLASSWDQWRTIKPTFARKFASNDNGIGRENGMLPHCYEEVSSFDGKGLEVWIKGSSCFKWQNEQDTISAGLLTRHRSTHVDGTGREDYPLRISSTKSNGWSKLHVQQMEQLNIVIQEKRPNRLYGNLLLHDNARSYIANMTKAAIQTLGWEVLPHPPYSPDLAATDFYLFRSLLNNMRGLVLNNDAELEILVGWMFRVLTE